MKMKSTILFITFDDIYGKVNKKIFQKKKSKLNYDERKRNLPLRNTNYFPHEILLFFIIPFLQWEQKNNDCQVEHLSMYLAIVVKGYDI